MFFNVNEDQRAKIRELLITMPFLGGHYIPLFLDGDTFVEDLIANLEILKDTLNNHVGNLETLKEELREYQ